MKLTLTSLVAFALTSTSRVAGYTYAYDEQFPLGFGSSESGNEDREAYEFKYPIKKVAIIGAGVGGLITYRELTDSNFDFDVHLFERDFIPGGNWHYTDETPVDTKIPSGDVVEGDYVPDIPEGGFPYEEVYTGKSAEERNLKRAHRAPKPIWKTLTSNAPAPIQQIREWPWPAGTSWALHNQKLQRYLRAFASWHGVNNNDGNARVKYNTRVEKVEEDVEERGWWITTKELTDLGEKGVKAVWRQEHFDAVIVATGRYNAPNVPSIPGIKEWNERFPGKILHSRQYRVPEPFEGETVLIVGAATSGGEISREVIKHAKKVIQSIRPDKKPISTFPLSDFLHRLPHNVTLVPEIKAFHPPPAHATRLGEGKVELVNGTTLTGIDRIIFATGYRYTFPFLPQYHDFSLGTNGSSPARNDKTKKQPIVTDGTHLRSLYLDVWYIPNPTLTFINLNYGMQSFTYAEFLSLAIGKVWSRTAFLPATPKLWERYDRVVEERKGYGRHFQFLGAERTRVLLRFFQGWLNAAAVKYGGKQIDGLSQDNVQINALWSKARFADNSNAIVNVFPSALGLEHVSNGTKAGRRVQVEGTEEWVQDAVYSDWW